MICRKKLISKELDKADMNIEIVLPPSKYWAGYATDLNILVLATSLWQLNIMLTRSLSSTAMSFTYIWQIGNPKSLEGLAGIFYLFVMMEMGILFEWVNQIRPFLKIFVSIFLLSYFQPPMEFSSKSHSITCYICKIQEWRRWIHRTWICHEQWLISQLERGC